MQKDIDFQVNENKAFKGSNQSVVRLKRILSKNQNKTIALDMHLNNKC